MINHPYGGELKRRFAKRQKNSLLKLPSVVLSEVAFSDLYNIAEGVFSPLEGFMARKEFLGVVKKNEFKDLPWTIPILLDIDGSDMRKIKNKKEVALKLQNGSLVGWLEISDIYRHDKDLHAQSVFSTRDQKHPGVKFVYAMKEYLLGGGVFVLENNQQSKDYLSPRQTRLLFKKRGFKSVAGFQTRNVLHRAHEYLQRCALELVDGLFLQPIVGWKKSGDFTAEAVVRAYREFIKDYYPKNRVVLGTLKTAMRYAGPKEAVFHAIIRKNFGCTHFIVGRDHAGVGGYYGKYAAHDIFDEIGDIGINILKFKEPLYCSKCDLIVTEKTCGHNKKYHQEISGTLVRKVIKDGQQPKHKIFRPEVYDLLEREFRAHHLFYD